MERKCVTRNWSISFWMMPIFQLRRSPWNHHHRGGIRRKTNSNSNFSRVVKSQELWILMVRLYTCWNWLILLFSGVKQNVDPNEINIIGVLGSGSCGVVESALVRSKLMAVKVEITARSLINRFYTTPGARFSIRADWRVGCGQQSLCITNSEVGPIFSGLFSSGGGGGPLEIPLFFVDSIDNAWKKDLRRVRRGESNENIWRIWASNEIWWEQLGMFLEKLDGVKAMEKEGSWNVRTEYWYMRPKRAC